MISSREREAEGGLTELGASKKKDKGRAEKSTRRPKVDLTLDLPCFHLVANVICLSDVYCYFTLLEGGRPEDKLECEFAVLKQEKEGGVEKGRGEESIPQPPFPHSFEIYLVWFGLVF